MRILRTAKFVAYCLIAVMMSQNYVSSTVAFAIAFAFIAYGVYGLVQKQFYKAPLYGAAALLIILSIGFASNLLFALLLFTLMIDVFL